MHRPSFFPFALIIPIFLISIWSVSAQNTGGIEKDFFPFSVWYSGGKARAPMLSNINDRSEEEWREELQQIRELGLNTVRTWVEWATCAPEPGEYKFEKLIFLIRFVCEVRIEV